MFFRLPFVFWPDTGAALSTRPLTLRRNSVTKPHRLALVDLLGGLVTEFRFWAAPDLGLVCRVPVGEFELCWDRFHSPRSLELEDDEEGLKLGDEEREEEFLRYSLGEEVEVRGLSTRPANPSSEVEMCWERAETREGLRILDGLFLTGINP